jgi:hypothetical protein
MSLLQSIGEIGFGVIFLVGAVFNLFYTLRHGEEFYGSFAENAWFPPSRVAVRRLVIPHSTFFTLILVVLQLVIATLILTRGDFVKTGLIMGGIFSLGAAFVSSKGGAVGNIILSMLLFLLAANH